MKKMQLNVARLQLKKEKISSLTSEQMSTVRGGSDGADDTVQQEFTYSLSWGKRCKNSRDLRDEENPTKNPYQCGEAQPKDEYM